MPEKKTVEQARRAKRQGKAPSTQAGAFVHEEIEHIREGKHGARSTKQAIAIGLSKARRAGVKLPPPKKGQATSETREQASRDYRAGQSGHKPSARRSRAVAERAQGRTSPRRVSQGAVRPGQVRRQTPATFIGADAASRVDSGFRSYRAIVARARAAGHVRVRSASATLLARTPGVPRRCVRAWRAGRRARWAAGGTP